MQVTKRLEYAVISALYIAKRDKVCDISEIASSQNIPVTFLAKILQDLNKAGIVSSKRGLHGGYSLSREAGMISLLNIMEAVEGPIAISECLKQEHTCGARSCELQSVWGDVQDHIQAKLEAVKLADIIRSRKSSQSISEAAKTVILCDFDGTISTQDVADSVFTKWLGEAWARIDEEYHSGAISMVELYEKCWPLVDATEGEIVSFIDSIGIDPYFERFIEDTQDSDIPVYLVSDGFDYYIDKIMGRYGLSDLKHYSNHLRFEDGTIVLVFDNQLPGCAQCANCKRAVIDKKRESADYVVYIGNGNSDRCAVEHADLVFAKDSLLQYCEEKGIPHVSYKGFDEVIGYLADTGLLKARNPEVER